MCYCTSVLAQRHVEEKAHDRFESSPRNSTPKLPKPAAPSSRPRVPNRSSPAWASSSNLPAIFTIDPRSGVPFYHQLIEQVKRAVAMGTLGPGEQLPTVKALAFDLTINPNTVARAYRGTRTRSGDRDPSRTRFLRSQRWQRRRSRASRRRRGPSRAGRGRARSKVARTRTRRRRGDARASPRALVSPRPLREKCVNNLIAIRGLTKRYGTFEAVTDLTLEIEQGRSAVCSVPTARASRPRSNVCSAWRVLRRARLKSGQAAGRSNVSKSRLRPRAAGALRKSHRGAAPRAQPAPVYEVRRQTRERVDRSLQARS